MSNIYNFGDLRIITNAVIDSTGDFSIVQCSPQEMNLSFGNPKLLYISGKGTWTHSVLLWYGKLNNPFSVFVNSLHKSTKIYANDEISLWLLKNDTSVGTFEVSAYVNSYNELTVKNNYGNEELRALDRAYNVYRSTGSIDHAIKALLNINRNIDFFANNDEGARARDLLYTSITEPFSLRMDEESQRYEKLFSLSHEIPRKRVIREIIYKMYTRSCEIEKNFGH